MMQTARRCIARTQTGERCRAWAVRDSHPPLCRMHRAVELRTPAGFGESGFYSRNFTGREIAELVAFADEMTLDDEIAVARVALARLLELLATDELDTDQLVEVTRTVLTSTTTISRLLRDKRALSGEAADGIAGAIGVVVDELVSEWGIRL